MSNFHNYDREPIVRVSAEERDCHEGWEEIFEELKRGIPLSAPAPFHVAVECYPGVDLPQLTATLRSAFPSATILSVEDAYKDSETLLSQLRPTLTPDPVFGIMRPWEIEEFFEPALVADLKQAVAAAAALTFLIGTGTQHILQSPDLLLHASVTRWELQQRQRSHKIGNLGLSNLEDPPSLLYKGAFFLDWRLADDLRHAIYSQISYFLDLDNQGIPLMVEGSLLRKAVADTVQRPFRVVPFFDPGPWGGQWMKKTLDLPEGPPNYAWCFDCVPEENSITFGFGSRRFHMPAITLVHEEPVALLGEAVFERFGAEFPIRFDLLDTIEGGNLSLQVHPLTEYIAEHFAMPYTQDESYYILDCEPNAQLYLGLREGTDRSRMESDLRRALAGRELFAADRYVNTFPTRKHDHFSIPAGTIHCSGSGNLVLEISATPYIFTFKLWDWQRVGLDGKPRPIHLEHGLANIQWDRDSAWVERELIDQVEPVQQGYGWKEERTGLHKSEFLETRRTWFTKPVAHDTKGTLHVLNLVEGEAISVESPTSAFAPFEVHYAETFIVPAAIGPYIIRPLGSPKKPLATIKAYVRS